MLFDFDAGSGPSLDGSNSDDYGMVENRLSSLEGLPQASWRSGSSEQAQWENSAMSSLTGAPLRFLDSCVFPVLPYESQFLSRTMDPTDLLDLGVDGDCLSEALPHARKETSSVAEQNFETLLGNPVVGNSSFHLQIVAERVLNSIEYLRVFYEIFSNMSRLEEDGYGDSESLPQAKKQKRFSPPLLNDHGVKIENSLNRGRQFGVGKLDTSSENQIAAGGRTVACGKKTDQGYWQWMSPTTQESLTESPLCGIDEGGESKSTGEKRSGPKADLDDLLSSLRSLLSVLKKHEETEQIFRSKMQVLRERKEALNLQKQQYKDQHKRQHVSRC